MKNVLKNILIVAALSAGAIAQHMIIDGDGDFMPDRVTNSIDPTNNLGDNTIPLGDEGGQNVPTNEGNGSDISEDTQVDVVVIALPDPYVLLKRLMPPLEPPPQLVFQWASAYENPSADAVWDRLRLSAYKQLLMK